MESVLKFLKAVLRPLIENKTVQKTAKNKDRFVASGIKNTQEVFSDFQKKSDLKPAARDEDLSKMLDDVFDKTPKQEGSGLYGKPPPRPHKPI